MMYLGDYAEDDMLDFMWSSNAADGASITRSTNGTISVYKGNSTTQSTAGVTDTEDFDSLTGIHHCRIDLSADAFYATNNDYMVVLSAATIDGETVNAVLAMFSIQNRYMRGTDSAYTGTPPTAGAIADQVWDEALSGHATAGSTGEALDDAASVAPPSAASIADAVWDEAISTHSTAGSTGDALDAASAAGDPWGIALPGAYTSGEAGWIIGNRLDAKVSAVSGNSPGAGAVEWAYALTEAGSGDPIADADVWITTDSAGSNVIASGRTGQDGAITFYLDSGTVYVWRQKSGYNFVNPDVEIVA